VKRKMAKANQKSRQTKEWYKRQMKKKDKGE